MAAGAKPKTKKPIEAELLSLSQQSNGSSDDGMAAVLVQKIQSGMDKKKKDKEARYFQVYQQDTQGTNARGATEFIDYCAQIDEIFDEFTLEYAKVDDEIRAIWTKIISAHAPFAVTAEVQDRLAAEVEQDKEREEQQVLGLAYHKKSEEAFARAISSLVKKDSD